MGIENPVLAYQFNRVVELFGNRVDGFLDEKKKVKRGKEVEYRPKYSFKQALKKATRLNSGKSGANPYMLADLQKLDNSASGYIDD